MTETNRIIGLTGGIATGKSTVARYLAEYYHLRVIDADILARDAVKANSPILQRIITRYGQGICLDNGELNRPQLGEIIFQDEKEKNWLEGQIHPFVRQELEMERQNSYRDPIVFVIPLLFEAEMTDLVTETWVVICPLEAQIERLMQRNGLTKEQAISRINSQMPLTEKVKKADQIIDNSGHLEALWSRIDQVFINR